MIKRLTKAQQPKTDQVKLDHENALERSAALGTLGGLVRSYTKYAHILQDPATNPFNKKAPKLTTTDAPWYNYDPTPNAEGPSQVLDGVLSIGPGNGPIRWMFKSMMVTP